MKRIVALFALLTAVLSVVAQGRELPPEHGSDRTCYSADGTKIYRYYDDDCMIVRQVGKDIPGELLTTQPDWFSLNNELMRQFKKKHEAEFHALGERFQLERRSIIMRIHISLTTGRYFMSEIWLRNQAVALADQLPLDYLFSLFDEIEVSSRIFEHAPCKDDNKYMTYLFTVW